MEDFIFQIKNPIWKSALITDDKWYFCGYKCTTREKFDKELTKSGMMRSCDTIDTSNITKITFTSKKGEQHVVKFQHKDAKGNTKKAKLVFEDRNRAEEIIQVLGERLSFNKEVKDKNDKYHFLTPLFFAVLSGGMLAIIATMDSTSNLAEHSTGKNKGKAMLLQFIIESLGKTTSVIICAAIVIYFLYKLYKAVKSPPSMKEYEYSRAMF